ncbi:hypothetical protein PPERSA_11938 [Pseudocohnilembus persalinus]|uniref:Uncharacterized protein n=1 Tax=Pseudocohnilembus persalinus TaxID=266149 RepID=A0A0V0QK44_PSEPJ|nr:hypothetical protein PPERSA_11938 [Pseudocohnilembus persalinus]|eukprot:KRX02598.1 hypothetical protein PPERSA_11938 [Pseudocohnilembus persalinus]
MPIYNETWDQDEFAWRTNVNLKTLPENHLERIKSLKFDFVEYKTHQLLACHLYERLTLHCMNQYGMFKDFYRPECMDVKHFFEHCVTLNAAYGLQKKYFPEMFVGNKYSRSIPHVSELTHSAN